jgi:hypothetical protein
MPVDQSVLFLLGTIKPEQFAENSCANESLMLLFSYQWNFGNMNATSGNPNTAAPANPSHITVLQ